MKNNAPIHFDDLLGTFTLDIYNDNGDRIGQKTYCVERAVVHLGTSMEQGHYIYLEYSSQLQMFYRHSDSEVQLVSLEEAMKEIQQACYLHCIHLGNRARTD